jgi:hypothetical protein
MFGPGRGCVTRTAAAAADVDVVAAATAAGHRVEFRDQLLHSLKQRGVITFCYVCVKSKCCCGQSGARMFARVV